MLPARWSLAACLLAALCLTGCGNPAARLHGKWKMSAIGGAEGNPLAALAAQMMKFGFEFKNDGSCTWNVEMLGQQQSGTGTWKFVKSEGKDLVISLKLPPANKDTEVRIAFQDDDHCSFIPPEGMSGGGQSPQKAEFVREK